MIEYVTAEEYYTQALTMYRKVFGEESNHEDIANELKSIGVTQAHDVRGSWSFLSRVLNNVQTNIRAG